MKDKENLLILYPGSHLAYSPSVLNLYDCLSSTFNVTIASLPPSIWSDQEVSDRKVSYIRYVKWLNVFFKLSFYLQQTFFKKLSLKVNEYVFLRYLHRTIEPKYSHVIAIDTSSLAAALWHQSNKRKVHFLSLEIYERDPFIAYIDFDKVESVLIQSEIRLQHYLKGKTVKFFILPNSPIYKEIAPVPKSDHLLYCGTVTDFFGFYSILKFLRTYKNYKLTVKGAVNKENQAKIANEYADLLNENRLIIDTSYASEDEIVPYIKAFKIGFCFYDTRYENINTFNYYTAPSGKLFKYLAAGVPVVVNNLIGLTEVIHEFQAGAVVNDLQPDAIHRALVNIISQYELLSDNCLSAAKSYDFKAAVDAFIKVYK